MAFSVIDGTETIGTTEWSLTTDTAGPDADTTECWMQVFLDLSALAAGDQVEMKIYEKIAGGGTQRLIDTATFTGVQSVPIYVHPPLHLKYGWDVTLKKLSGTDRSISWSLRKTA
jgi:hypothetical protein